MLLWAAASKDPDASSDLQAMSLRVKVVDVNTSVSTRYHLADRHVLSHYALHFDCPEAAYIRKQFLAQAIQGASQ